MSSWLGRTPAGCERQRHRRCCCYIYLAYAKELRGGLEQLSPIGKWQIPRLKYPNEGKNQQLCRASNRQRDCSGIGNGDVNGITRRNALYSTKLLFSTADSDFARTRSWRAFSAPLPLSQDFVPPTAAASIDEPSSERSRSARYQQRNCMTLINVRTRDRRIHAKLGCRELGELSRMGSAPRSIRLTVPATRTLCCDVIGISRFFFQTRSGGRRPRICSHFSSVDGDG